MKQKLIILVLLTFSSLLSWAYSFSTGGLNYQITDKAAKTVEIASCSQSSQEKVVIPRQVVNKGVTYTVTGIGNEAFKFCSVSNVTIPNTIKYIGEFAFLRCENLCSITIPNSVKSIGRGAFSGCNLKGINIPGSVTKISEGAFYGNSLLCAITVDNSNRTFDSRDNCNAIIETATNTLIKGCSSTIIPQSVLSIGDAAFSGCASITNLIIPKNVTSIGKNPFRDCQGLEKITVDKDNPNYDSRDNCNAIIETATNCLIVGCKKTVIPETVKIIGESAFYECSDLMTIKIPSSIEIICDDAFGYSGLIAIDIPGTVKTIGSWTFQRCSNLRRIVLSDGIERMGSRAIYVCPNLPSIKIPKSLDMPNDAIGSCANLNSISVEPGNPYFDSRENCNALIETSTNTLLLACNNTVIPNSVERIADNAFSDCKSLTEIIIPKGIVSIGAQAFSNIDDIKSISVAKDNPVLDSRDNCNAIIETATGKLIKGCNYTTMPRSIKSIEDYAFDGCTNITSIELPEGLTHIGYRAFGGCSNLNNIKLPKSLAHIGSNAFSGTPWLNNFLNTTKEITDSVAYINDIALLSMPNNRVCRLRENTKSIAGGAFANTQLESISIPSGVEDIGSYAFWFCRNLRRITIPNNVKQIGDYTFYECRSLNAIDLPHSMEIIGSHAFCFCTNLKEIVLPNKLKYIDSGIFAECNSLTNVTIGDSVKSIDRYAFGGAPNISKITVSPGNPYFDSRENSNGIIETSTNTLIYGFKNTTIPNGVTSIGVEAFAGYDLQSITIPSSVTTIGEGAFWGCNSLKTVINNAKSPQEISENCFTTFGTLIVPEESKSAYKNANVWNKFNF